jgi:diguanylate cyclase (GGDEF)-like protein
VEAPLRVLIIEDSEDDAELVRRALRSAGYVPEMLRVQDPAAVAEALDRQEWDLIIADHSLPGLGSPDALALVNARELDVPFMIVSGTISEEQAVTAMRAGACDYILKDRMARLPPAVKREIEQAGVRRIRRDLEDKQRAAEREIARMATEDQVSGLPNRGVLQAKLEEAIGIAQGSRSSLALLHLSLDRFVDINATLGHSIGDELLRATARRLEAVVTVPRCLAHLGGPHFGVILAGADSTRARAFALTLAGALEEPIQAGTIPLQIELSIGIALYPGHGERSSELMRCAAVAMTAAQGSGTGLVVYSPHQNKVDPQALPILAGLRNAIATDQLFLEFQPVVDLREERTVSVEALVRWEHPQLGRIPPGRFIPLAESSGLIRPLSRWVLGQGMAHWRSWHRQGVDLPVAVNFSARNFAHPDVLQELRELMETWGVTPGALEIEITESALMSDPERTLGVLQRMHAWGVSLAIDDFGTGYSSFSYLRELPIDKIKIDRSFVTGLTKSERDASLVRAMIELGHTLGLKVVAEGVEDEVTYNILAAFGCDMVQGFFVSKSLGNEDLVRWLGDSQWGRRPAEIALEGRPAPPPAPLAKRQGKPDHPLRER